MVTWRVFLLNFGFFGRIFSVVFSNRFFDRVFFRFWVLSGSLEAPKTIKTVVLSLIFKGSVDFKK